MGDCTKFLGYFSGFTSLQLLVSLEEFSLRQALWYLDEKQQIIALYKDVAITQKHQKYWL